MLHLLFNLEPLYNICFRHHTRFNATLLGGQYTFNCCVVRFKNWISSVCFFSSTCLCSAALFSVCSHFIFHSLTCFSNSLFSCSNSIILKTEKEELILDLYQDYLQYIYYYVIIVVQAKYTWIRIFKKHRWQ